MSRRITISGKPAANPTADAWVRAGKAADHASQGPKADVYTARLTLDITPELRGRIKVAAFHRGVTVAELLRALLEREFLAEPASPGRES
jgi:hypothetical protein